MPSRLILASVTKILDALLFAGPALALLSGFLFGFASSKRVFARLPLQIALGVAIPMLVSLAGALRMRQVESDSTVLLTVIGLALGACLVGFAGAFGFGVLLRAFSGGFSRRGARPHFGDTGVSTLTARRSRRKGLPPGPKIKQGK